MAVQRFCLFLVLLSVAGAAQAGPRVGTVSRIAGQCTGEIGARRDALVLTSAIELEQVVATGQAARLEITFADDTALTLGERARLRIDRFVYDPNRSRMAVAVTGALRFVSGAGKRPAADVIVTTPVVTIGVRGTDFWTGPIDGQFGVLLLEGAVSVSNAAGSVVLDQPGEGVNIAGPGAAPGEVTQWPQDKVQRALAAVAF